MRSIPTISAADYAALRFLRRPDVDFLRDVDVIQNPVLTVICSDGHQFAEKMQHQMSRTECEDGEDPCHHMISTNGGALVIAEDSPIAYDVHEGNQHNMAACCLINVRRGCIVKQPRTIVLKTHFPCAMATSHKLSVADVLSYQAKGYTRLMGTVLRTLTESGQNSVKHVVCHTHVNYRGHREERPCCTYAFNPEDRRIPYLAEYIRDGLKERQRA